MIGYKKNILLDFYLYIFRQNKGVCQNYCPQLGSRMDISNVFFPHFMSKSTANLLCFLVYGIRKNNYLKIADCEGGSSCFAAASDYTLGPHMVGRLFTISGN